MSYQIIYTLLLAGSFLVLFGFAEILYHVVKIKAGTTRKIVHTGTGLLTMFFPLLLGSHWLVLLLCASFALILLISLQFGLLPSINAIDRVSYGSLLYPVAVYGSYLAYNRFHNNLLFFYLPVLTMAVCDPAAAIFGKRRPFGKFYIQHNLKTAAGSLAFFCASVVLTTVLFYFLSSASGHIKNTLAATFLIAFASTAAEAISVKGFDNITIPASVVVVLTLVYV